MSTIPTKLTLQDAADLLNVSVSYLNKLLKANKISFCKIDNKRFVLAKDILKYKAEVDRARYKALRELSEQAQKLDMGY